MALYIRGRHLCTRKWHCRRVKFRCYAHIQPCTARHRSRGRQHVDRYCCQRSRSAAEAWRRHGRYFRVLRCRILLGTVRWWYPCRSDILALGIYIGLPVSGVALILLVAFLHVQYEKDTTVLEKLRRLDYAGNAIFILSMVSILIALTYGGTIRPSSSWRTIVPLTLRLAGLVAFHLYEASGWQKEPVMPPRLFANRTSAIAFVLVFIHGMALYWVTYFLPVYSQAVLLSSATRSGVQTSPTVIVVLPFVIIAGGLVTSTGRYNPLCIVGFGLQALSVGLLTLLDSNSSTAEMDRFLDPWCRRHRLGHYINSSGRAGRASGE